MSSDNDKPQSRIKVSFIITAVLIGLVFLGLRLLVSYPQLSAVYFQVTMQSSADDVAKVYYDLGEGLSEKDSTEVQIMGDQRFHDYRFRIPKQVIGSVRFDPLMNQGSVTIKNIEIVSGFGKRIGSVDPGQLRPVHQIKKLDIRDDEVTVITEEEANDPQISVSWSSPALSGYFSWAFCFFALRMLLEFLVVFFLSVCFFWLGLRRSDSMPRSLLVLVSQYTCNLLLLAGSLVFMLFFLEIALTYELIRGADFLFVHPKYKAINQSINSNNALIAKNHPHRFVDIPRKLQKEPGTTRIAVLGDSFIWGDGVDYDNIWSHKLEKLLSRSFPTVEVISWGHCGWSTKDEYDFLTLEGIKYNIDYLIVGYVTNDTSFGDIPQLYMTWQNSSKLSIVRNIFPYSFDFLSSHLNRLLEASLRKDHGYVNWENLLYAQENLFKYKNLLSKISIYCSNNDIQLLFVLTPNFCDNHHYLGHFKNKYELIIPLLNETQIPYINLLPSVCNNFSKYSPYELAANKANGHPGPLVTSLYAEEVYNYLTKDKVFNEIVDKNRGSIKRKGIE